MASYLADTNILLRASTPADQVVERAILHLQAEQHMLVATSQNFVEAWNVFTRPETQNGLGLTPANAAYALQELEELFPRLPDRDAVFDEWKRIVRQFEVSGVQVHDARLVATMHIHGIRHILTLNTQDFRRYEPEGIISVHPRDVVTA